MGSSGSGNARPPAKTLPGLRTAPRNVDPLVLQGQELMMLRRVKAKFEKQLELALADQDRERITAMREALVKLEEQEANVRSPRSLTSDELDALNIGEVGDDLRRFQQHDVIQEALSHEVDLRMYSQKIDKELRVVETASLPDYLRVAPSAAALNEAVAKCDRTLKTMENVFTDFQGKLSELVGTVARKEEEEERSAWW